MNKAFQERTAITPTRKENYPEWYQQVVKAADLAEGSPVRGCMVIKPWGYSIWESIQKQLDDRIKKTGHQNAYFPLFIPLSFLQKEAEHVEGFAKECAVVTHHRLELKDGKLVPAGPLEEPLIVRPTSETIIGEAFSRWIHSYRDLPLLINQWANVVRWEMRPRLFLRTAEFLWQEGHTAHANLEEAMEETLKMLEVYRELFEEILAIPVILGRKSPGERFPGAVETFTLEAMMQDGKALQGGTSHFLGQNFSKASNIQFSSKEGPLEYAYTTSWGMTTRTIGALTMVHSDDDGLRLPPRVAAKQAVIIPVVTKPETQEEVFSFCDRLAQQLRELVFCGQAIDVIVDKRDMRGGEKSWEWIKKGIPLRIEVGPRDVVSNQVVVCRRDKPHKEKLFLSAPEFVEGVVDLLKEIQNNYFTEAKTFRDRNICREVRTYDEFKAYFESDSSGFVLGKWSEDPVSEEMLNELKVTIRCLPLEQSGTSGKCVLTGKPATTDALFAKSY